jgi:hypothetical protein
MQEKLSLSVYIDEKRVIKINRNKRKNKEIKMKMIIKVEMQCKKKDNL